MLTILDGSTFVVSDDIGDVGLGAEGVFADDTRMLSRCRLLLDGESPLLLTSRAVDYFSATHYLRNAPNTPDSRRHGLDRSRALRRLDRDRAPHPQQREHVGAVVRRRARARRRLRGHHLRQGTRLRVRQSRVGAAAAGRPSLLVGRGRDVRDRGRRGLPDDDSLLPGARAHAGRRPLLRLAPGACQVGADLRRPLRPGRRVGAALARPDLRHRAAARA